MPYKTVSVGKGKAENITKATGKGHGVTTPAKAKAQMVILQNSEVKEKTGKGFLPPRKGK